MIEVKRVVTFGRDNDSGGAWRLGGIDNKQTNVYTDICIYMCLICTADIQVYSPYNYTLSGLCRCSVLILDLCYTPIKKFT